MNLFTRKMQMFCVSNIMVSFVCTGFLGINGYSNVIESPKGNAHEISLTSSDAEPVSHNGEDDKREDALGDVNTIVTAKTTTNVVKKKEVKNTFTYAPAEYSSVTGDAIVSYAKRYLGLRYKTGTPSLTNGADCSGFTMLIFREFGVSLPRSVADQARRGTYVNKRDLQKGDLVFYRSSGSGTPTHVAIYIGGGQVIHESRPGVGVKISPVNMMVYITSRRVINSKAKEIAEQKLEEEKKNNETVTDTTSNDVTNNDTNLADENLDNNVNNNVVENTNTNTETNTENNTNTNTETNTENNTTTTQPAVTPVEQPKEESNPTPTMEDGN